MSKKPKPIDLNEIATLEATIDEDLVFGTRHLWADDARILVGGWFWKKLAAIPTGARVKITIDRVEEA